MDTLFFQKNASLFASLASQRTGVTRYLAPCTRQGCVRTFLNSVFCRTHQPMKTILVYRYFIAISKNLIQNTFGILVHSIYLFFMFKSFISRILTSTEDTHSSIYLIGFVSFFVYIFAFIRNWLLATSFGAGVDLDIYFAAFKIADVLYIVAASFVSAYALIPLFEKKYTESKEAFQSILNAIFTIFACTLVFLSVFIFFLVPFIADSFFQTFSGEDRGVFIFISRLLLLQSTFFGLSAFFSSIAQFHRQFFVYALTPALYNIGIIVGILFFYPVFGLKGLVLGVILGSFLHLLFNTLSVYKHIHSITLTSSKERLKEALIHIRTSFFRSMALTLDKIALFFLASIATSFAAGSLSVFAFANDIRSVPFVLIGVSCSIASIKTLSTLNREGNKKEIKKRVENIVSHITLLAIPATIALIIYRAQIVRLFLGDGAFDWVDTRLTAAVLAILAFGILAKSITHFMSIVFYSINNTILPFIINATTAIGLISSLYAAKYIFEEYPTILEYVEFVLRIKDVPGSEVAVLAITETFVVICAMVVFLYVIRNKYLFSFSSISHSFFVHVFAGVLFGYASYLMLHISAFFTGTTTIVGLVIQLGSSGMVAFLIWGVFLYIMRDKAFQECLEVGICVLPQSIRKHIRTYK